jgi:IS5 family transposase
MSNNSFQNSFMSLWFNGKKKIRAKIFLSEMDSIIPYTRLLSLLEDKYNTWAKTGRKKYDLKLMLKIYFLQQFYELWDLAMEEAIYDRISFQEFLWIDVLSSIVPDETTILNFRHFLEKNNLQDSMFKEILLLLQEQWFYFQRWTIVDASIIKASSHTKNKARKRDPEMSSTKKNNNFFFWMKTHIGVDADSGIVHSIEHTTAKKSDISQTKKLLHWKEKAVFWDKAYSTKAEKRKARKEGVFYGMTNKATRSKKLSTKQKKRNKQLSSVRSKVEHPFRLLKCQFHHVKAKYRWLKKNGAAITMKLWLWNLFLMRKRILQS